MNVAGSALLGFLLGVQRHLGLPPGILALAGVGFCGGVTTFSTPGYEALRLLEDGALGSAGLNMLGSLVAGLAAAFLGFALAVALQGKLTTIVNADPCAAPARPAGVAEGGQIANWGRPAANRPAAQRRNPTNQPTRDRT